MRPPGTEDRGARGEREQEEHRERARRRVDVRGHERRGDEARRGGEDHQGRRPRLAPRVLGLRRAAGRSPARQRSGRSTDGRPVPTVGCAVLTAEIMGHAADIMTRGGPVTPRMPFALQTHRA